MRLLIATALVLPLGGFAQCLTTAAPGLAPPLAHPAAQEERGGGVPLIIPTVFHVYVTEQEQSISPTMIMDMLAQANIDLRAQNTDTADVCSLFRPLIADLGVELRLARIDADGNCMSGILYHLYPAGTFLTPAMRAANSLPTSRYLNVHIYGIGGSSGAIPGMGSSLNEPLDCIMLSAQNTVEQPRVFTHELGHWFGLWHTFGLTNQSGVTCGDDYITDTPPTMGSVYGTCDTTLAVCTPGVVENVNNFMDYSACGVMFTQEQAAVANTVLTSTSYPRYLLGTPENLLATGDTSPPPCDLVAEFNQWTVNTCVNGIVHATPIFIGQVPTSWEWLHPGATMAPGSDISPVFYYDAPGIYNLSLVACNGPVCDTLTHTPIIWFDVNGGNGLLSGITPYAEDFEPAFTFADAHLAQGAGSAAWEPHTGAGYASTHCLRVPPSPTLAADTIDLLLGNFDLSALSVPGIRFQVATSLHAGARPTALQLLGRDLCATGAPTTLATFPHAQLAGTNTATGFAPTADAEWVEVAHEETAWTTSEHAELTLRLIREAALSPLADEAVFVDDINLGEAGLMLPVPEAAATAALLLAPNPGADLVRVHARPDERVQVLDLAGRVVHPADAQGPALLDVRSWPPGSYLVQLRGSEGTRCARLLVER